MQLSLNFGAAAEDFVDTNKQISSMLVN